MEILFVMIVALVVIGIPCALITWFLEMFVIWRYDF